VAVTPFHDGMEVTAVTVASTVVMVSETPLILAWHTPEALVVHESLPNEVPLVRRNVTVTVAFAMEALVTVFLRVTVKAGRHPEPLLSELAEVLLTNERCATVVVVGAAVVVVVGAAVVVVGGQVVVVVGAAVVVVGAAVVVVGAAVVLDDPPGIEVPVGVSPLALGRAPMRLLVVS